MEQTIKLQNARLKFDKLYNNRPSTLRSTAFHSTLRVVYLLAGLAGLAASIFLTVYSAGVQVVIAHALESVKDPLERKAVEAALHNLFQIDILVYALVIALTFCLLIMARLCRKIVQRNLYITDLETTWQELNGDNFLSS